MSLGPAFDGETPKPSEVFIVRSREDKPVHVGNRGDLAIDEWRWSAQCFEPRPLPAVPRRSSLIVREDWK